MFVRQASVIVLIREYLRSVAVSALGGAGESRPASVKLDSRRRPIGSCIPRCSSRTLRCYYPPLGAVAPDRT